MKALVYNAQLAKHLQIQHTRPCEVHVYLMNIWNFLLQAGRCFCSLQGRGV